MELIINILASLLVFLSPQASSIEPLTHTEIGVEVEYTDDFGDIGVDDKGVSTFGFNVVEEATNIIQHLEVPPSKRQNPTAYEYVASYKGGTPDFDETFFTITSPTDPTVEHVFQAVTHWTA